MNRVEVAEWGRVGGVALDDYEVGALARSAAFDVRPDPDSPGRWVIGAGSHVGVARVGSVEVRVRPKVPVVRLVELLAAHLEGIEWDPAALPELGSADDLVTVLAAALNAEAQRVLRRGALHGYREFRDALPTVRGRVLAGAQMSRRAGLPLPVELVFDDFTSDIVENRLVVGAARLVRGGGALDDRAPGADRADRPSRRGTGFLVDMNRVFEKVVEQSLEPLVAAHGATVSARFSDRLDRDGQVVGVTDVKYKDPTRSSSGTGAGIGSGGGSGSGSGSGSGRVPGRGPRSGIAPADVYQVLAYAHRYDLSHVHLMYPTPSPVRNLHVGGVTVTTHHVDLTAPRSARATGLAVLAERLAERLAEPAGTGSVSPRPGPRPPAPRQGECRSPK